MTSTDIETNYLLTCISEECSEIIKEACKGIRFGLDNHYPGKPATNGECLINEFYDLCAIVELLQEKGELPEYNKASQTAQKEAKKLKIQRNYRI